MVGMGGVTFRGLFALPNLFLFALLLKSGCTRTKELDLSTNFIQVYGDKIGQQVYARLKRDLLDQPLANQDAYWKSVQATLHENPKAILNFSEKLEYGRFAERTYIAKLLMVRSTLPTIERNAPKLISTFRLESVRTDWKDISASKELDEDHFSSYGAKVSDDIFVEVGIRRIGGKEYFSYVTWLFFRPGTTWQDSISQVGISSSNIQMRLPKGAKKVWHESFGYKLSGMEEFDFILAPTPEKVTILVSAHG